LLALNKEDTPFSPCKTGTMFIRHAEDIITDIALMGELSVNGELLTKQEN
jgi:carbamoyl-phosphate synthase large subunit